ncbi:MAG TPA: UDP-N-acetylmuramate dehydrogenase [Polyangiaceae bacterium]|nr:UDP-N-acetylmuramate dehydrogenase [Polyangiaceae bacterium]
MRPRESVELAPLTTLGIGGVARFFFDAPDVASVRAALSWAKGRGTPTRILGGGSNVVVSDDGFDGLVLRTAIRGCVFRDAEQSVELTVHAGEPWDDVVRASVARGLQGLECLSGIPGWAGATPIQNVGAYGQEVAECIERVDVLDRSTLEPLSLAASECRFAYRDSRFKSDDPERFVVLAVHFRLRRGAAPSVRYAELARHLAEGGAERPTLLDVREAVLLLRGKKSMLYDTSDENGRSCGSFFTNPVVTAETAEGIEKLSEDRSMPRYPQPDGRVKLAAGWLIERAGFAKGHRQGPVGLSTKHALAIVCHDGARATDVLGLAETIRAGVRSRFGVTLVLEPVVWS